MNLISPPKHAVITAFLSKTRDRFHEYNTVKTFEERLQLVTHLEGFSGVEIIYPYEVSDANHTTALLQKYQLAVAAVNVNVKAEPEFRNGGLTSKDPIVRRTAVRFIKQAKDFAKSAGANKVTCCPLGDGYEFNFNCDYQQMRRYLVEAFSEAAEYLPEIPLFIEYKPSETRGRCFVDTAAKALCLLHDIGNKQMGVTLDYGHSKYGDENPSEVLALLVDSGFPYYIHINDNNGKWDWDYMVASNNYLSYVEFLYYLRKYNYTDFLTSDTSPTRWDIKGTFEANSRLTTKIWQRLHNIDINEFEKLINEGNFLRTWQFIEANILRL
jgi:xylose isomerase